MRAHAVKLDQKVNPLLRYIPFRSNNLHTVGERGSGVNKIKCNVSSFSFSALSSFGAENGNLIKLNVTSAWVNSHLKCGGSGGGATGGGGRLF